MRRLVLTVTVTAGLLFAGCGASSSHAAAPSTTTAAPITTTTSIGTDGVPYAYPPGFTPSAAVCSGAPFGQPWSSLHPDEQVACIHWGHHTPEGRASGLF